jgi:hypothetical protein
VVAGGALESGDVGATLREFRAAAKSIRSLAEYLERDPNSIIFGRSTAAKK